MANQNLVSRIGATTLLAAHAGIAKFKAPANGSVVRVFVIINAGNGNGPTTFDLKVGGVSTGQVIQIAAGQTTVFKSIPGGAVLVSEGDDLALDLTAVPAGGVSCPLWAQVVLDDDLTYQKWTSDLYLNTVLVAPSGAEMTSAVNSLSAAQSPMALRSAAANIVATAFNDARYTSRARTDVQYIEDLCMAILGRPSDPAGHAHGLAQLTTQGGTKTRANLRDATVLSIESINVRLNQMFPGSLPAADASFLNGVEMLITEPADDQVWAYDLAQGAYVLKARGAGGGGGGGGPRTGTAKQTAMLAHQAQETGTVALGKSFMLIKLTLSAPARVRLYSNAAARTADAGRAFGTDPAAGTQHGLICDLLLSGTTGLSWAMSPPAIGANTEAAVTADIAYAIQNLSGGPAQITATFTSVSLEA